MWLLQTIVLLLGVVDAAILRKPLSLVGPTNLTLNGIPIQPTYGTDSPAANRQLNASSLTDRPESPYPLVIPGSLITIIFDKYGRLLRPGPVYATLFEARFFVGENVIIYGPLAPVGTIKSWKQGPVVLEVTPSDRLTWFNLLTAMEGVIDFVSTFETFAFSFDIRYQGSRSLGTGQLRMQN